ncbi:PLP-dependent aminotransferase family protein [Marinobacter nanhaiticus D15-8W]|uniref:PLP-dependent aminotransferase family protein n=1 Tax=Marinobacter nanhaiticus D15-8W TaxID=626887 RepID=N6W6P5_9GAMM|nr:PLP-dependent aminotransferase family protein [Marinobacter nanhaiticus]ENO15939.1 PLP-dependent aminotransferase family protein [Marinobacter nanhaiticus D15-8W]BES73203.1 PLP-dependent aminotransferase family protein [Marinobacter nanhaiticus D15-8W]
MTTLCFALQDSSERGLQEQLREGLLEAIRVGSLPTDAPLPSCRKLSRRLGISRNTVAIVYEKLVDDGFLVSRPRSGYYLHADYRKEGSPLVDKAVDRAAPAWQNIGARTTDPAPSWRSRLARHPSKYQGVLKPSNWTDYPYPFIYGQPGTDDFPIAAWREISRRRLEGKRDRDWLRDRIDQDDALLIEQIRKRLLPRRGILAQPDEILVTLGSQNALFLLAQLLFKAGTRVGLENPGYREAVNVFQFFGGSLVPHNVDSQGIELTRASTQCDYLYVMPSHQVPTGITMSRGRRDALMAQAVAHDQVIIEDDYDAELHNDHEALPALKASRAGTRVIYLGSFSKVLSPGLRMGYLVADAELIEELRALRRLMYRHPPANLQHQMAQLIAQGYYETYLRSHVEDTDRRRETLLAAINTYLPQSRCHSADRASAFWLEMPAGTDTQQLAWMAAQRGVLIEPGFQHFQDTAPPRHFFRLGFNAIERGHIVPGIERLASVMHSAD